MAAILCDGCTAASNRQYLQSEREWQALCRAMRATSPKSDAVNMPDDVTSNTLRSAADRARPAVVWIATAHANVRTEPSPAASGARVSANRGGGSGIFVAPGLVLTNEHVIRGASSMTIVLSDGRRYRVERTVTAVRHDLAVLKVTCPNSTMLPLCSSAAGQGIGVAALGGPHFPPSTRCRIGVIECCKACMQRELDPQCKHDYASLLQTTAELQPGFSGGPLLDESGRVIGISVASSGSGSTARGYAIPMNDSVRATIEDLCRQIETSRLN